VGPPGFEPGTTSVLGTGSSGVLTPGWHPTKLDYGPSYDHVFGVIKFSSLYISQELIISWYGIILESGIRIGGEEISRGAPYLLRKSTLTDSIVLIHEDNFNATVSNDQRLRVLTFLARGITRASQIAEKMGIIRTAVYRHLHFLEDHGWIIKHGENYLLTSKIYLVYRAHKSDQGIFLEVLENKGAFIDEIYGLLAIVNGVDASQRCMNCLLIDLCRNNIEPIARKLEAQESNVPAIRIISSLSRMVKKNIDLMMRKGFVILKR
jgi:biotin operon repressor